MVTFVPEALHNVPLLAGLVVAALGGVFLLAAGGRRFSHTRWLTGSAIFFGMLQVASQVAQYQGWMRIETQLLIFGALSLPSACAMVIGLKEYFEPGSLRPLRSFVWLNAACLGIFGALLWISDFWHFSASLVVTLISSYLSIWLISKWRQDRWSGPLVMSAMLAGIPATFMLGVSADLSIYDFRQLIAYPAALIYIGVLVLLVIHDAETLERELQERLHAETAYRDLAESLEQQISERTASLSALVDSLRSFAGMISHDLRAPLRNTLGLSRAAIESVSEGNISETALLLHRIERESARGAEMVQDLLSLTQVEESSLRLDEVDLNSVLAGVIESLKVLYPEAGHIIKSERLPSLTADPSLIRHAFTNLLSNSLKFGADKRGLSITVGAERLELGWRISVRDNGPGFNPAEMGRLFKAFERLAPASTEGTGLGLTIVRRVVERHGGTVGAESMPGQGALFWFELPHKRSPLSFGRTVSPSPTAPVPAQHEGEPR